MRFYKYLQIFILLFFFIQITHGQRRIKNKSNMTQEDITQSLNFHNKARKDLNISPLKWSVKLANDAQEYAENLARRNKGLVHSMNHNQGENLYVYISFGSQNFEEITNRPGIDASISWYNEIKFYRYSKTRKLRFGPAVGHYTQMIWESTKELGIGWAVSSSGKLYVVARYFPAGNWIGEYPYEKSRKIKQKLKNFFSFQN